MEDNRNKVWCGMGHKIGCTVCKEPIYVPNWFDKADLEELIDNDLTQEQFDSFMKYADKSNIPNKITDLVRNELYNFFTNEG